MTSFQKMFLDLPFFGTQTRVWKTLCKEIIERSVECLEQWSTFKPNERELARKISIIIQRNLNWPNDIFLPLDPFEILIWDRLGDLRSTETIFEIEKNLCIRKTDLEWEKLAKQPFGEVVQLLSKEFQENTATYPTCFAGG